jgi:hypothetical protein
MGADARAAPLGSKRMLSAMRGAAAQAASEVHAMKTLRETGVRLVSPGSGSSPAKLALKW